MLLDRNSLVINGVHMADYILEAKYGYHKLWDSKSGRNLAGSQTGTLVGIFPKITLQFRKLTQDELELLAPILDSAYQNTVYYDPRQKGLKAMETYSNDWEVNNKTALYLGAKNEGFSWAVISRKKRELI